MRAVLYFTPLFRRLGAPLLLSLALSLATLAAGVALLGISGWFLTAAALSTAGAAFNLFGPSAGVRGLSFVRVLSRYGERLTGHNATLRLLSDLRRWMFGRLFRIVPLGRQFGRADVVSRLIADLDMLDTLFLLALGPIATALVTGVAVTTILAFLLPQAVPVYAAGYFAAVIVVPFALIVASRKPSSDAVAASAALRQSVLAGIDGHQDLVVFGATGMVSDQSGNAAVRLALARRRVATLGAIASTAVQLLTATIVLSTLLCGVQAIHAGIMDGPLFVGILLAIIASFEVSAILVRSATRLASSAAAAQRLVDIAEAPCEIVDPATPGVMPDGGEITFDHVSFGYGGRHTVLEDTIFSIIGGECVAIRGPSGSGKSTIAQLAVRLIDPLTGTVAINGVDVRRVSQAVLRTRIVLMTQDAPVFNDTVRANLLIGKPDADDEHLWHILDVVRLGDAIRALPGRLDAILGEAGRTLSAGQARRICLARTLLSHAAIIVLDEPTNGLDAEAEAAFLEDLPGLAEGRTMIVITHADVPASFSRVLTVRAGRIAQ